MKTTTKYTPSFTRAQCHALATECLAAESLQAVGHILCRVADDLHARGVSDRSAKMTWAYLFHRAGLKLIAGKPMSKAFHRGNTKLNYTNWSTLPGFTCPGAGACLEFCYSFKAWRYPAAFLRQLSGTLMLKFDRRSIINEWKKLRHGDVVRLYVDGDIDSIDTLQFWCNLCQQRPDLKVYGYSKSWHILNQWHEAGRTFPANYVLNVSSGSRFDDDADMKSRVMALPISRGEFIAIPIEGDFAKGFARYADPLYHAAVLKAGREAGYTKAVSCPGDCNACGHGQHWCSGMDANGDRKASLQGLVILNGAH
jgi:hypothetical protein